LLRHEMSIRQVGRQHRASTAPCQFATPTDSEVSKNYAEFSLVVMEGSVTSLLEQPVEFNPSFERAEGICSKKQSVGPGYIKMA